MSVGFGTRKLNRIPCTEFVRAKCTQAAIHTVADLYAQTPLELSEKLDLHMSETISLMQNVAEQIVLMRPVQNAYEMLKSNEYYITLEASDEPALRINKGITELVASAGMGKTQFCFGAAVKAGLPHAYGGLEGGVIWIDTEGAFAADRLIEIAQRAHPNYFNSPQRVRDLATSVHLISVTGHKDLTEILKTIESKMLTHNAKLLIVDGIAQPMRALSGASDSARHEKLSEIASQLKYLSENLRIPVIVTNQVSTSFNNPPSSASSAASRDSQTLSIRAEGQLTAALGAGWAHAVNTRFMLERGTVGGSGEEWRMITVAKSPIVPVQTFRFTITEVGARVTGPVDRGQSGSVLSMRMQPTHHMTIGTRAPQMQTTSVGAAIGSQAQPQQARQM